MNTSIDSGHQFSEGGEDLKQNVFSKISKEIDVKIQNCEKANSGNFCSTFLMIDIERLEEMRGLLMEAVEMDYEKLIRDYITLKFNESKAKLREEANNQYTERLKISLKELIPIVESFEYKGLNQYQKNIDRAKSLL